MPGLSIHSAPQVGRVGLEELPTDLYGQTIIHTNGAAPPGHPPCDTDGRRSLRGETGRARCELLEEPGVDICPAGAVCVQVCVCRYECAGGCRGVCVWVCGDLTCQL